MTFRPHLVAPAERAALRELELLARTTVEGLRQGLHRSPFHGYSAEFSQYRHYRPGDDLKYVDWKAFARTDRLYSRQFRETTNLGALFVIDVSRSMAFPVGGEGALGGASAPPAAARSSRGLAAPAGSGGALAPPARAHTKFDIARAVSAVLGTLVIDQGDAAGLLAVLDGSGRGAEYVPARSGRQHLSVFLSALARLQPAGAEPVAAAMKRAAALMRRRGLIIVLSDCYEEDTTLAELRRLSRMGHDVILMHTLAREELDLPRGGAAEFEDLETGARIVAEPEALRQDYQNAVQSFLNRVQRGVEREGLDYLRLFAGEPIEPPLRRFLIGRRRAA